jgi:hypothetical protein
MRSFVFAAILAVAISGCVGGPDVLRDPDTGEIARPVIEVVADLLAEGAPGAAASGGATLPALGIAAAVAALIAYRKRKVILAKIASRGP